MSLWCLAGFVCLASWQAYAGFENLSLMTTQERQNRDNELWFFAGPISFFLSSALGFLFSIVAVSTKQALGNKFWSFALWVTSSWLATGAFVFLYLDWFGGGVHRLPSEQLWYDLIVGGPMLVSAILLANIALMTRKMPIKDTPEHAEAWKRTFAVGARILAWLGLMAGSILAVFAGGLVLLLATCTPPSLPSLARRFPSERADLELLIHMSDQDSDLSVIDPSWLELRNGLQFLTYDPKAGITEARWNEYRRIFRRNDITQGIRRYQPSGDAFIIVKSVGILDSGYSNGFLFCGVGPEHAFPPCSSHEMRGEHAYTREEGVYSFIRVADRWYAFSQGPG